MPPTRVLTRSWEEFRADLLRLFRQPAERRKQILFRGMSSPSWKLVTTFDRTFPSLVQTDRERRILDMHAAFNDEAIRGQLVQSPFIPGPELELLARHHGLPSPQLDFTSSPYIAAFFAYAGADPSRDDSVSVWTLDRNALPEDPNIVITDEVAILRYNRRALAQHGVFVRLAQSKPLDEVVPSALFRFDLRMTDRLVAMKDLEAMGISSATLMCDLEGVADTITQRFIMEESPL